MRTTGCGAPGRDDQQGQAFLIILEEPLQVLKNLLQNDQKCLTLLIIPMAETPGPRQDGIPVSCGCPTLPIIRG